MSLPVVVALKGIHPFYLRALESCFTVHTLDPGMEQAAMAGVAPQVLGLASSGESKVPASLMAQFPALKIVSVFGVGYDGVDLQAARTRGIAVTHTPGVLTDDVADLAMALMLAVARGVARADQHVRLGKWPAGGLPLGRKVSGARLGIVGLGRIGHAIAKRAQAFDMEISYTARSEKSEAAFTYYADAQSLAAAVDFLVVITPGGAATRNLVNAEVLKSLGSDGYLINVARGSVIDEDALVAALQAGTIAGAGLDVFASEPQVPEALWAMPNVVLTPHIASGTVQTREAMAALALANMQAGTSGQPVRTMVPELQESTTE